MRIVDRHRRPLAAATALLVALGASPPVAGAPVLDTPKQAEGTQETVERVRRLLLAARSDGVNSPDRLALRLYELGPRAVPVLLESIETATVPGGPAPRENEPKDEDGSIDARREAIVVDALCRIGRPHVAGPLAAAVSRSSSPHAVSVFIGILGAVGNRGDVTLLCGTVRPSGDEIVDGEITDAFQSAVTNIVARDPATCTTIHGLLRDQPDSTRNLLVRALADTRTEGALEVLAAALGSHGVEDDFLLRQMTEAAASVPLPIDERVLLRVRTYLRHEDVDLQVLAANGLGVMQDIDSVPALVQTLRSEEPRLVRAAHDALRTITGVGLHPDPNRWEAWLQGEERWSSESFPELAAQLDPSRQEATARAIAAMASHPMYRREIAETLERRLGQSQVELRRIVCAALHQLGAETAAPLLETWSRDADRPLAAAAQRALAALRRGTTGAADAARPGSRSQSPNRSGR